MSHILNLLTSLSFWMKTSGRFVMTKEISSFSSSSFWIIWDNYFKVKSDISKSILTKKGSPEFRKGLSCEYCEIFKNTWFFDKRIGEIKVTVLINSSSKEEFEKKFRISVTDSVRNKGINKLSCIRSHSEKYSLKLVL